MTALKKAQSSTSSDARRHIGCDLPTYRLEAEMDGAGAVALGLCKWQNFLGFHKDLLQGFQDSCLLFVGEFHQVLS